MRLPRWIRSTRPSRNGSSELRSETNDDPPPYPGGQLAVDDAVTEHIKNFTALVHPTPGEWQVNMLMFPTTEYLAGNALDNSGWVASVTINAQNLPRLMRSGFHVTEDNVRRKRGHILLDPTGRNSPQNRACHLRKYFLRSEGSAPKWRAQIIVAASTVRELSQFRVPACLSAANVAVAVGYDKSGRRVYNFSILSPDDNFNAIYDDMPMEGWWPWPRKLQEEHCAGKRILQKIQKWKSSIY